jgi:GDP-L-fucose synthase
MYKDSKIYVAGHLGLIGSGFIRKLRSRGFHNLLVKTRSELDLMDVQSVNAFFASERPDYVVLAAGMVGGIAENKSLPADFIYKNISIQTNVLHAAHVHGVRKLIFFGSSCMYPRDCPQPMSENYLFSGVPESTSMAYAVSKMAGLQMCHAFNEQYGMKKFIPVIPNSVYGPNDNFNPESGHVLSALIRRFHDAKLNQATNIKLWGSGNPRREFIHADDVAETCLALLEGDTSELMFPLNLGVGQDYSIGELAELIAEVVGFTGQLEWDASKPDGAPRKLLDSSRVLAFTPKQTVSFMDGLKNTYQWYLDSLSTKGVRL